MFSIATVPKNTERLFINYVTQSEEGGGSLGIICGH